MEEKRAKSNVIAIIILLCIALCVASILVAIRIINNIKGELFSYSYPNSSKVGYYAEYLGTIDRNLPEISNEGLQKYPVYGVTLSATDTEKQAILDENNYLLASSATYDSIDENGNLYLNGQKVDNRKLYKHSTSIGMYEGDIKDDEPAIIKKITIKSRSGGNHITGLYAPAGEVIKIEMSQDDFDTTGGLVVQIGQVLTNGDANNIWLARDFCRMPIIVNTMTTKTATAYVGSYFGGPIYISPVNKGTTFTVTISGGVPYSHFILGYTTIQEFTRNQNTSTPYFDLEVWDDGVRHSGPKSRVTQYTYDDLYNAAILWDKIALVSNQVPAGSGGDIGINFLYDPFVAAGAMVAFVGRHTVNCPLECLTVALDYDNAVTNASGNFWGCIHEFNHHYQRFGFTRTPDGTDEVTNNALSIVSYSLFTSTSSNRHTSNANEGNWADNWNRYTNPSWVLKQTLDKTSANNALDTYVNIIHSFGQDNFIKATKFGQGSTGVDIWYQALCETTHYDMSYYFTELLHQNVSSEYIQQYTNKNYPMYVPIATIYQTGVSYIYDGNKEYSQTVQPYEISFDEDFTFDLANSIVIPNDFSFVIKKVTQPTYGKLIKNTDGTYTYSPQNNTKRSGAMYVTLGITHNNNAFEVADVNLVIEFASSGKANLLERTIYTYSTENMYTDLDIAYDNNFAGYLTKIDEDNTNRVQNGNAEIWEPSVTQNAIMEIRGKIYIKEDAKYRIALRGRNYASLYVSIDNKNFTKAASVQNLGTSPNFDLTDENHYSDYSLKANQWLYFKAYLLITASNNFVGVGWGQFEGDNVTVTYLNAYRNSYEPFISSYFYNRDYTYTYDKVYNTQQTLISTNYQQWDNNYPIDLIFDSDNSNYIHSNRTDINAENPFELTVDLGETISANTMTIYGEANRLYLPTTFQLYAGTTLDNLKLIKEVQNANITNNNVVLSFDVATFRYYKIVVTDTSANSPKYIAFRYIQFSYKIPNGKWIGPDDNSLTYYGNWQVCSTFSTFGHIYTGEKASIDFNFICTQFAILAQHGTNYNGFEVYIDDKKINTIDLTLGNTESAIVYLSPELKNSTHKITIKSAGKFNIDSIVIW